MEFLMASYKVYFQGRNTPICVAASDRNSAISKARTKKKRGGDKVVSAKKMTAQEIKTARNGGWVSTRPDGKSKAKSKHKGKGYFGR